MWCDGPFKCSMENLILHFKAYNFSVECFESLLSHLSLTRRHIFYQFAKYVHVQFVHVVEPKP